MIKEDVDMELESFSKINKFKDKIFVVKYGGSIMDNEVVKKTFIDDVVKLKSLGINIVVIHGGGPKINGWLDKVGIERKTQNGLRITDKDTMEMVEMVLCGNVNKDLSFNLSKRGLKSIGLSGKDSNLIKTKKKYIYNDNNKLDIGFVGEVVGINTEIIFDLLKNNYIPVISPVGCDYEGNTHNINADYVAAYISGKLNADKLLIMTDIEGVYKDIKDKKTLISSLTIEDIKKFIHKGIIQGGMIPKLESCIQAIESGTKDVHLVDGRMENSLVRNIVKRIGTKIIA